MFRCNKELFEEQEIIKKTYPNKRKKVQEDKEYDHIKDNLGKKKYTTKFLQKLVPVMRKKG
ncbi:MAG: hypothetical protein ABIG89_05215, partial [Candidatus Woesearchaeota archaeon]